MKAAVFLDRDGTMLEEHGYLTPSGPLIVFPWTIDAIRLLQRLGFVVVVVTNQGGIGRGRYSREFVEATHQHLGARFADAGAPVDAWYYCPHHPEALVEELRGPCDCRKPEPGMVVRAARDLDLDLAASWVIGDFWRDVAVAHRVGARSVLVRTGHGAAIEASWPADIAPPTLVAENLIAAVAAIADRLAPGGVC